MLVFKGVHTDWFIGILFNGSLKSLYDWDAKHQKHSIGHCKMGPYKWSYMSHGQKSRFIGDGRPPTFNDGILIMGI